MNSPTQTGGDVAARERRENLDAAEAEAQHDVPTPIVQEPEPQAAPEPEPDPAPVHPDDERMAKIEARAEAAAQRLRDAQGRFMSEADDDESAEVEEEEPDAEEAEEAPVAAATAKEKPAPANLPPGTRLGEDGQWYVDLKADGIERSMPYAQYMAQVQKALTADARVQQAALIQKQLEQEALRRTQSGQLPVQGAGVVSPPQGATQEIPDELWDQATLEGNAQARKEFVEKVKALVPQPQIDPAAIEAMTRETVEQAFISQRVQSTEASLAADPDYGQVNARIMATPSLRDMANERSAALYEQGWTDPEVNVREAVRQIREELMATFVPAAPPPAAPPVSPEARTHAKAQHAAVNVTRGAQSRAPYQPPAMTAEDMRIAAIAEARRERGLI